MEQSDIRRLQDDAEHAYNRLPSSEAGPYAIAIANCEIALQLAKHNELLDRIAFQIELLTRIAKRLEEQ